MTLLLLSSPSHISKAHRIQLEKVAIQLMTPIVQKRYIPEVLQTLFNIIKLKSVVPKEPNICFASNIAILD